MSQVNSQALMPVPLAPRNDASPPGTTHIPPGAPVVQDAHTPRSGLRAGVKPSTFQPGLAQVKPVPLPGTMAFNDAQTQHWATHTPLTDTPAVAKARMLATIAQDQADAGIQFKGQLKPAEAQRLAEAERVQTSQALRAQNPIDYAVGLAQHTVAWMKHLVFGESIDFGAQPGGIHAMPISEVTKVLEQHFEVTKSAALVKREKQGDKAQHIVFAFMVDNHDDARYLAAFKTLLRGAFDGPGGDHLRVELVHFDATGRQVMAQEHRFSCYGIPGDHSKNCNYFNEPATLASCYLRMREYQPRLHTLWSELLRVLPSALADSARMEHRKALQEVTAGGELALSDFVGLAGKYMRRTDRTKDAGLRTRYNAFVEDFNQLSRDVELGVSERTVTYWKEIGNTIPRMAGNLFTFMGSSHGPVEIAKKWGNKPSDFKGDSIAAYYLSMKSRRTDKRDL